MARLNIKDSLVDLVSILTTNPEFQIESKCVHRNNCKPFYRHLTRTKDKTSNEWPKCAEIYHKQICEKYPHLCSLQKNCYNHI